MKVMDLMTAVTLCQYHAHPKLVTKVGRYTTRKGEVVTIERFGGRGGNWAYGQYADGTAEAWFVSGRLLPSYESVNDIVAVG